MLDHIAVAHVPADQFYLAIKIPGPLTIAVDLFDQIIEHANSVPARQQLLANRPADKACSASDEYILHGQSPHDGETAAGKAAHCSRATTGNGISNIFFYRLVPRISVQH
ncbi:hypothetical protein TomMM35A_09080 [Sphingobium sp. TomMM35A]